MIDKLPVYIFSTKERTRNLCIYSYRKLGFRNINLIEGDGSFKEKYIQFVQHASSSGHEYFIRADADLVVFDGLLKLIRKYEKKRIRSDNHYWFEGQYFDYFMNDRRHGTPHIIPKIAVDILANDSEIISNSKRPENDFSKYLVHNNLVRLNSVKIITCLHEYEQYPSKICNSFLNRLKRGHRNLYDFSFIESHIPRVYGSAINHAIEVYNSGNLKHPNSMNFLDFSNLDDGVEEIQDHQLDDIYMKLKYVYSLIIKR